MKPMLPTLYDELPTEDGWYYEVKYDGFRGILSVLSPQHIRLQSRNDKELLPLFPEIEQQVLSLLEENNISLPFILDGEIVILRSPHSSEFSELQVRGRMRNEQRIKEASERRPAAFLAFDLLQWGDTVVSGLNYQKRKEKLKELFTRMKCPLEPAPWQSEVLQMVPAFKDHRHLFEVVQAEEGEGIVAKKNQSKWEEGKRSTNWIKYKNWKTCRCFITSFDENNNYFFIAVYDRDNIVSIGSFHFGLSPEEKRILKESIRKNSSSKKHSQYFIEPSITVELKYLHMYEGQLREPHFNQFLFNTSPDTCTMGQFQLDEASLPPGVDITHPDKDLYRDVSFTKLDYIRYLRKMSVVILPLIKERPLTCIRYPHGVFGESFYQKNTSDYAPSFVTTSNVDGIDYILCNNLQTLLWLGNQLALELHVPFQKYKEGTVSEIVFDLDPPDRKQFSLAVKAAKVLKGLFDQLNLHSFVKTSGNKGLQVYIPIPAGYSWDDTSRFTEFIARYLVSNFPDDFTIERLKKNRKGRLYVDYIQHGEGKTIIAPYSLRGNDDGLVATPLFWHEVNDTLHPERFTPEVVLRRFQQWGCPFRHFESVKGRQPFDKVMKFLKEEG
ncbi:DNA ligase D [Bacillus sp. KH172YL63]|uniref:DNA ligase D n=1 Tax=Bacillus sp. KH172YL63 TaxID=2709784 RepID=UPI0015636304|nr:DNA ligase D [Bacillus sp. KH172YL63]